MQDNPDLIQVLPQLSKEEYCYLTTTGRKSGHPHEIEIWFGIQGDSLYLLSGNGEDSDWVRNLRADPHVIVRNGCDAASLPLGLSGREKSLI